MRDELLKQATRIVIKIGSSLVASRDTGLRPEQIDRLADEIATLLSSGREVLIVSSGAIVSGIKKLGLKEYPNTLSALIGFGVIPIINENDTVAVDEIRVGDNDTLAAEVAHLVDADLLIILSDIDGLFTEDPRKNPAATLIPLIPDITEEIEERAGVSTTFEGTGGMATKIRAAKKVSEYGVATLILNGQEAGLLPHVLAGGSGGSLFLAKERRFSSRKHWIAFTLRPRGTLTLDPGAVEALARRGKSLLASGILDVSGPFDTGDAVSCLDQDGKEFAKGLVNFSSDTLARIKGLKTTEIQQRLGQQEYEEVIHRDNLVIL